MSEDILSLDIDKISSELKIRKEIYLKIVKSFSNTLQEKMKNLNEALSNKDKDQLRLILHEIKGTAGNLRLSNISGVESKFHDAVKGSADEKVLFQYYNDLNTECEKLILFINKKFTE